MLIGASQFGASAFASPADTGADPRRLIEVALVAGGGVSARISPEYALSTTMGLGGDLDAPFVRIRRTGVFMRGLFGQGAYVAVSPVMITLDGGGGLSSALTYAKGRLRSVLTPGGGITPRVNASLRADVQAKAGGGLGVRLSEYQKVRATLAAGGAIRISLSKKHRMSCVFGARGGVKVSPWYDLIGEIDLVYAKRPFVVLVTGGAPKITLVSANPSEDITVLEVGI